MQFIRQPYTINYMDKDFDVYVLFDDMGSEYRTDSNRSAFDKVREVRASKNFCYFQAIYNPNRPNDGEEYKDKNVRLEVDPYEDEGDGYTIHLLLAFKLEQDVLPIKLSI